MTNNELEPLIKSTHEELLKIIQKNHTVTYTCQGYISDTIRFYNIKKRPIIYTLDVLFSTETVETVELNIYTGNRQYHSIYEISNPQFPNNIINELKTYLEIP